MPNTLITINHIADVALANLYETCVAAQLVYRDYSDEFVAGRGRKIGVRRPTVFTATEFDRTQGITVQNAAETSFDVTMDHLADVSFAVTSEEWTMDVTEFETRFVAPAMEAIAQKIDRDLLNTFRNDLTQTVGAATPNAAGEDYAGYNGSYPWSDSRVLIQASEVLNKRNVPASQRRAIFGPSTAARYEAEKTWRHADRAGDTAGLREAMLRPRVSGFDTYMSQNIGQPSGSPTTGQPTTEVNVAFHETACALVTRPLALPRGATDARIVNYNGFGLRIISGYSQDTKEDVISIDCLYGIKTLDPNRAVLVQGALAA